MLLVLSAHTKNVPLLICIKYVYIYWASSSEKPCKTFILTTFTSVHTILKAHGSVVTVTRMLSPCKVRKKKNNLKFTQKLDVTG